MGWAHKGQKDMQGRGVGQNTSRFESSAMQSPRVLPAHSPVMTRHAPPAAPGDDGVVGIAQGKWTSVGTRGWKYSPTSSVTEYPFQGKQQRMGKQQTAD